MNLAVSGSHYPSARCGASLIELLAAMSILSVILLMLSTALDASLGQFRISTDRSVNRSSGRAALQWIEQDLRTTVLPIPLPFASTPNTTTNTQREFFSERSFLPFEINRLRNADNLSSLPNAANEFGRLCFAAWLDEELILDPGSNIDTAQGTQISLVGYYVAFTKDTPLASDNTASMKLFRHLRPASPFQGGRYSSGFLLHNHLKINASLNLDRPLDERDSAAIRRGNFTNRSLPALIGMRREDPADPAIKGSPAWPALPLSDYLLSPPPSLTPNRGEITAWQTAGSSVHDTVFPDQPVCSNVIRFELEAFRRLETSPGILENLDAEGVNSHFGLNGGSEWPCLVVPDYLKLTLSIVSESVATTLTNYQDWIIDWAIEDPSQWSDTRKRIEGGIQTFEIQIQVRRQQS
ncbi:MAG: prepilin-type N-terminal cleavage/methylation domain-containing protein [Verrucomicrobiales bacterium]|nr:prepilin-type N-terminal cleavage/methylation domain-containing protein [Verrucomicrobiales bacterium]